MSYIDLMSAAENDSPQRTEGSVEERCENSEFGQEVVDLSLPVTAADEYEWEQERMRRIYRGRTMSMLRRYMRYSIESGRLPSLLGTSYRGDAHSF